MTETLTRGLERQVKEILKESSTSFTTRRLAIERDLSVRLPGSGDYEASKVEIEYKNPLNVNVSGLMASTGSGLKVRDARVAVIGERTDQAVATLDRGVRLRYVDPEVTIYGKDGKVAQFNQIQGSPVIRVRDGEIYKR